MRVVQPVTALFDINRESVDGRTLDLYRIWLEKTISIFPDVIVFHDGSCDSVQKKVGNFIKLDKQQLWAFQQLDKLLQLLRDFRPLALEDITFKNPLYGLLQFSKFEFLSRASVDFPAHSFLWIDAGISRFLNHNLDLDNLEGNASRLLENNIDYSFEIDLRNNLSCVPFGIRDSVPGTCKRVISGTSFWINSLEVNKISEIIRQGIVSWVKEGIWDNEQVMLRRVLPILPHVNYVVNWSKPTGSVARSLLEANFSICNSRNLLLQKLMLKTQNL
jgi:hypothetical protein